MKDTQIMENVIEKRVYGPVPSPRREVIICAGFPVQQENQLYLQRTATKLLPDKFVNL